MQNKKLKSRIISALRRISYTSNPERDKAKALRKVGPAMYKCDKCSIYVYEGQKDLDKVKLDYDKSIQIIIGKLEMDHKNPIVNPTTGWTNWDDYINSLICDHTLYNGFCTACHKAKTAEENTLRTKPIKMKKKE